MSLTPVSLSPLGYFLQTSMLSTDTQSQEDEGKQPVRILPSILTCMIFVGLTSTESDDHHGPFGKRLGMARRLYTCRRAGYVPLLSLYRAA